MECICILGTDLHSSMVDMPVTLLEKTDSAFPSRHQLQITSWLEIGSHLLSAGFCLVEHVNCVHVVTHGPCVHTCISPVCQDDVISLQSSTSLASSILSSSMCIPESYGEGFDEDIRLELSSKISHSLHIAQLWVSV